MNFRKATGIVKIIRPSNVLIAGLTIFFGVLIFGKGLPDLFKLALLAGIAGALIDAGGNVINDYFDVEIDKVNKPNRPIPSGLISRGFALLIYFVLTTAGLFFASFLNEVAFGIAFFSVFVIFLYSYKLKGVPLVGNFTVAFMTGLAFVFAGSVVGNFRDSIFPFVFAFLINFGREIVKDIEDIEGDSKAGIRTFPIVSGVERAVFISVLVFIVLILATFVPYLVGIYNHFYALIILGVDVGLIFVIISLIKDKSRQNLNRLSNILKFEMLIGLFAIYFGSF
ncbi:MAG: geranylgeranylglycerol-phosphate geranylgeranyltransferase [Candidatus Kryptonium sp.]|nr:geranylgeranylglycerol-phosphate geranylgeranyltransferase [Candidatus Kryptonium sp.]MCX7761344.1 geranylgeranylglycerol-phosphate geranylgeranyltransferase [Candidatus Kryptonium sp.]MDW8109906.1 geranylgeranylglycerol-phosphate geranylgeranyltransferase [Candidatus Kryptonium sp.]